MSGVSLYLSWRWRRGSFASFTISLPYLYPRWRGGAHLHVRVSPSTLGGGRGRARFHRQSVSLYLGGRGLFSSSESLPLPWMEMGEGLICIVRESPDILGGGGAHLHCQSISLYLGGRGSFASSECLPLSWVEVGEGLSCILHNVTPSTWDGGRGEAHLHHQSVSLYLGWRWERGSFALSECLSLYLGWRWGRGSFASFTAYLYLGWRWGRGSFASSECLPLPWVEVRMGLIYIIHRVSPSTLWGQG